MLITVRYGLFDPESRFEKDLVQDSHGDSEK